MVKAARRYSKARRISAVEEEEEILCLSRLSHTGQDVWCTGRYLIGACCHDLVNVKEAKEDINQIPRFSF